MSRLLCSVFLLTLGSSASAEFDDIQRIYKQSPSLERFEICHGNGCAKLNQTSIAPGVWQLIKDTIKQPAQNAVSERHQIAIAIGMFEKVVGEQVGTQADLAGTFHNRPGQMDCNDEAINTTTYMRLLKQKGYIQFHEIEDLETRNFFFNGWPHTTAVIREVETGEQFAVDSWFYDNGHQATIIPLDVWDNGYKPEDSPIGKPRKAQSAQ